MLWVPFPVLGSSIVCYANILAHLLEQSRVLLLLNRREGRGDNDSLLSWQVKVFSDDRFSMAKRDSSKDLTKQVPVVGDEMTPESMVIAEWLVLEEDEQSVQILYIFA